eukprot:scaffold9552_cov113-Isochrysis_galbana.AAC.2
MGLYESTTMDSPWTRSLFFSRLHLIEHFEAEEEEPLDEVAHLEVARLPRRVEADHEVDELGLDGARGAPPGAGRGEVALVGRVLWEAVVFDVALDAIEGYLRVAFEGHDESGELVYEGINVLLFGEEELPLSFGALLHIHIKSKMGR